MMQNKQNKKPAKPIKLAIFDMDGTIADSEKIAQRVTIDFFKTKGIIINKKEQKDVFGLNWKDLVREILKRNGMEYSQTLKDTLKERYVRTMTKEVEVVPGAHDLLIFLKNRLKLALATNSRYREVEIICSKLDFNKFFDLKLARDHVKNGKPDPEIYLKAADNFNVKPDECIVFEDSVVGIRAAKSANMACIAITNTYPPKLLKAADLIIESYDEKSLKIIKDTFL
ncbi:MAG: HAD family phosphatase [Actinobacteria bacterium]|nr:HAD family phosphatase [Actinomycetota bacterium]